MKKIFRLIPLILSVAILAGCTGITSGIDPATINYIQLEAPKDGDDIAVFDTNMGEISVLLYTEEVPEIVENFKYLAQKGYFDGTVFFQIDPEYKLAAFGSGDELGIDRDSIKGKPMKIQYSQNLWPFTGSLCTITYSQGLFNNYYYDSRSFFLGNTGLIDEDREQMESTGYPVMMKMAFEKMGGIPAYSQYHSVYGKIISGMDVVNAITEVEYTEDPVTEKEIERAKETGVEVLTTKRPAEKIIINKVTLTTFDAANYEKLDNCLTDEEIAELKALAEEEQAKADAAAVGETE